MPNFIKFHRGAKPLKTQALVTIQRKGTFTLTKAAFDALGAPETIALFFDPDERIIGFRATTKDDPDAYPVRKQDKSFTYLIAGEAFTKFFGIEIGSARRYATKMIDGTLTIDLNQGGTEVGTTGTQHEPAQPTR